MASRSTLAGLQRFESYCDRRALHTAKGGLLLRVLPEGLNAIDVLYCIPTSGEYLYFDGYPLQW